MIVEGPIDPARQPERTRLSWRRTVLATLIVVLLAIRLAVHDRPTVLQLLLLGVALVGWLGFLAVGQRRVRALTARRPAAPGWSAPATALIAVLLATVGIALVAAPG